MQSAKTAGRTIALAYLVQVLLAPPVYFWMISPGTSRDFLSNAAGYAFRIRTGLLLTFVLGAMTLTVAIAALPVIRRQSERMAALLLALSVLGLATLAADSTAARNMLSLSLEYAKPGAPTELLQTLGDLSRSSWLAAHYTNLMVAHGTAFTFYFIALRLSLVPRALALLGLAASALSTAVVTSPLIGYPLPFRLIGPMALTNVLLILWLLARGLEERPRVPGSAVPSIA